MVLVLVRHAESVENATKYDGFYHDPRPARSAPATGIDDATGALRARIAAGDTRWLTDKRLLAVAARVGS